MNFTGIIIGAIAFGTIGLFHPIVIWAEYHFSKRVWPAFLAAGIAFLGVSLMMRTVFLSSLFAVIAASCFWSIHELYMQEARVKKGWFPKNPNRGE